MCSLSVSNAGTARHKSSQASGVYTMSKFTRRPIYYNSLIFCIVRVCTSLLIFKVSYVTLNQKVDTTVFHDLQRGMLCVCVL